MRRYGSLLTLVVCLFSLVSFVSADTLVTPGARVAVVGDSITEQKLYSKYVEAYLLACSGVPDVKVFQFGWGGETAAGFAARLENDLAPFKPTVVTLCYGMNDGGYRPFDETIGRNYENNMRSVLKKLDAFGVKKVVVGSPGAVDSVTFRPGQMFGNQPAHVAYNDNLAHLRDIDRRLAEEHKLAFADVHAAMYNAMPKAKAVLGERYDVCGGDGFHPGPNGQLAMAYAFLKGLGLDGQIGTITLDLKGGSTASEGHQLIAASGGTMDLSSTRWPFCFDGDGKSSNSTRSIVPFLSFNEELNRLTLKVKNLDAARAKVTWGAESREFTREQLTAGVNLVAEFTTTPFDASFQKLIGALGAKQGFETYMIKQVITTFRSMPAEVKGDAELQAAFKTIAERLSAHQAKLDDAARATIVPVKHSLKVEPLQ